MLVYKGKAFEDIYKKVLKDLLKNGQTNSPRGFKTKEFIEPVTIVVEDMRKYIIGFEARKPLLSFYIAEFLWMLSGSNELDHIANYLPAWRRFTDDGETLNGAYGNRLLKYQGYYNQFEAIYHKLKQDINSRQGVMTIYDPIKDFKPTKDVPCNDLIQVYVRNGKLCTTIYARSQDIINGTFYDIGVLSHFTQILAGRLGLEVGSHTHICNSLHIYERDIQMAENIINEKSSIKIYDSIKPSDYRIPQSIYKEELKNILECEKQFRQCKYTISKAEICNLLSTIQTESWKKALALIAIVNLRKANRKEEAKAFYCLVSEEYYFLIKERWN